jgi:hypothetical protein
VGKKSKAPAPPDMTGIVDAQRESGRIWAEVAREQLDWAKQTDSANRDLLERVLGVQLPMLEAAFNDAQKDRARYENVFQPIEDHLIKEFQSFDSPEKREQEAATRMADVRSAYDAQRRNATRELEDYGIDPSQTRHQALDLGLRTQEAAAQALAANQGRKYVEETGRALRGEAINIGRGMPAQVAQSQGIVNQTAGGAVGNSNQTAGAGSGMFQGAYGAGQLSQGGYGGAMNTMNAGYQNQMQRWQANQQSGAGLWGGLGSLAGMAMGGKFGGALGEKLFSHEGGPINDQTAIPVGMQPSGSKEYPQVLEQDEYVIPADVVKRKGTEFFDKMLDKYRTGGQYEQQRQGVPT